MAKNLMIQGTMSNAGKSIITAGILRVLKQDGYSTAPFKSQNMALNSYITKDGLEMGRAQVMQAEAAGIEPCVQMNPILLKPTSDMGSQVIVNGVPLKNMTAKEYFQYKSSLIPDILKAYKSLDEKYDVVVLEGAGSPAEINLKQNDIVNMGMAEMADAPVLLVGDIDRGGVFAQLAGTIMLLEEEERRRVKGFVMNKFRGDKNILEPGLEQLYDICHIPVAGVIPYVRLDIEEEDSLAEKLYVSNLHKKSNEKQADIVVIRLPHISNFTDFNSLERINDVNLRYVQKPEQIGTPDLLIIPGSKNTIEDLKWLRSTGLETQIIKCSKNNTLILGICGGYQMLGNEIDDTCNAETGEKILGMGLLPVKTVFSMEKHRVRTEGTVCRQSGTWETLSLCKCGGYEIHMGESVICDKTAGYFARLKDMYGTDYMDGCVSGNAAGTYLHGIFDGSEFCEELVKLLYIRRGITIDGNEYLSYDEYKQKEYDKLADVIRENMDMEYIYRIMGL